VRKPHESRRNRKGGERLKAAAAALRPSRGAAAAAGDAISTNFSNPATDETKAAHATKHEYPEPESAYDPFAVIDFPAQQEIDARGDARIDAMLREREQEEDEHEGEEGDPDEGEGTYYDPLLLSERTPKQPEIEIVVFSPHSAPRVVTVENSLSALQKIVGGLIEVFPVDIKDAIGVCNEDFLGQGLPPNRYIRATQSIICGTFFIVGDGVNFQSLTPRQVVEVFRMR
jgi:hypothetical protein